MAPLRAESTLTCPFLLAEANVRLGFLPSMLMVASLSLALPAVGQSGPADYHRQLDDSDDGRVDLQEFQRYLSAGFEARDANANGVLDINEQPPGARRRPISRAAHLRAIEGVFRRQDLNRDGYLSVNELSSPPQG